MDTPQPPGRRLSGLAGAEGKPTVSDTLPSAQAVQALLVIPFVLMGLSHIVQPAMWRAYFTRLHGEGPPAIVTRTFTLELWPALLIVVFHRVWSGPGVILTVFGHLLLAKIVISLLAPQVGLRSLAMADKGDAAFQVGGLVLVALGGLCAYLAR
jgi:uncharacterized protein YjeT (DUF2065 family)